MKHYETLGVARTASQAEIKRAWRKLSSQYHPDRDTGDAERMAAVNAAYEILGNPERRARYDQTGDSGPSQQEQTMEQKAERALMEVFAQVIELDVDPVQELRHSFEDAIQEAETAINKSQTSIKKLEKRRAKVTVKKGDNIFVMLIDGKVSSLKSSIERCKEQKEIAGAALKLLSDYQYHPDESDKGQNLDSNLDMLIQTMAKRHGKNPFSSYARY
jgi:hypothetical protein